MEQISPDLGEMRRFFALAFPAAAQQNAAFGGTEIGKPS